MFYFCPMRIPSALRRKQDEIVATIARYEARIEAARMDLAVLNQVARLFDPEIGRDECERIRELEDTPSAECEVWESERPLAAGPIGASRNPRRERANTGGIFYLNWP
jgi:hypothetical protein